MATQRQESGVTESRRWPLRLPLLLMAMCIAGCAGLPGSTPSLDIAEPEPAYRELIAEDFQSIFPKLASDKRDIDAGGRPPADDRHSVKDSPARESAAKDPPNPALSVMFGRMEISGLRRVQHTKGWSWIACLRVEQHMQTGASQQMQPAADYETRPVTYAIFIQHDEIADARVAVQIDECSDQVFQPFELPPPATKRSGHPRDRRSSSNAP